MRFQSILSYFLPLTLLLMAILMTSGCYTFIGYDGPYQGKVINAQTNVPIEGVVAHGMWFDAGAPFLMGTSTYVDSFETLSDKNGEFIIKGRGIKLLSNLKTMEITIFKSGYEAGNHARWPNTKDLSLRTIENNREVYELEGNKVIFKLKPKENGKRLWYESARVFNFEPKEKRQLIDAEIEKDKKTYKPPISSEQIRQNKYNF